MIKLIGRSFAAVLKIACDISTC